MPLTINTIQLDKRLSELVAKAGPTTRSQIHRRWGSYMKNQLDQRKPFGFRTIQIGFAANESAAVVGSPTTFAGIHHHGGRIYPSGNPNYRAPKPPLKSKRGTLSEVTGKPIKLLTIPIAPVAKKKSAKDFENTFIFKSKKGNLLIAQRAAGGQFQARRQQGTRGKGIRLLYVLKEFVTLKARPYMFISDRDTDVFLDFIQREFES